MLPTIISLFVPNSRNNHKAFILHNFSLALFTAACLGVHAGILLLSNLTPPAVLGVQTQLTAEEIIRHTNLARLDNDLSALEFDDQLTMAAQAKAENMLAEGYWDHYSPNNLSPWKFILEAGYSYQLAGENLAKDYHDPQKLVEAWLDSPAHRANLLNNQYQDIGVAVVSGEFQNKQATLVVQFFGRRMPDTITILPLDNPVDSELLAAGIVAYEPQLTPWEEFFRNKFASTQTIALVAITVLGLIIAIDAYVIHRYKNTHRIAGKFWAHMLFIYTLGIITFLSK